MSAANPINADPREEWHLGQPCRNLVRAVLAAAVLCGLCVGAAMQAAAKPVADLSAPVPGVAGKSWLDLLRQVLPDLAEAPAGTMGAVATKLIDLRSIGVGDDSWLQCGGEIHVQSIDAVPVQLAGHDRLVVSFAPPDDCVGLLVLFEAEGEGKLLDAANVKGDQHVSFSGDYVRRLGPDGALVLASNWHDNSSQSYDDTMLVLASGDKFSAIGDVLAFGSRSCREQMTQSASIRVVPEHGAFARIVAEVKRSTQKLTADCEAKQGKPVTKVFRGDWRWVAANGAYRAHTRQLDSLASDNQKRF